MGCDIHIVLERRVGEFWVGVNSFESFQMFPREKGAFNYAFPPVRERNYKRFAQLAGVRGEGPKPRGLPRDASALTRLESDAWGVDGHSHSWLPLVEAVPLWVDTQDWPKADWPKAEQHDVYMRKYPASFFFGVEESDEEALYRVVFWFDN